MSLNLPTFPATTTVNGTAGSMVCSQPFQHPTTKKAYIVVSSTFVSVGGVAFTFPTPFATAAVALGAIAGMTLTTTLTGITVVVASALGTQALVVVEGY